MSRRSRAHTTSTTITTGMRLLGRFMFALALMAVTAAVTVTVTATVTDCDAWLPTVQTRVRESLLPTSPAEADEAILVAIAVNGTLLANGTWPDIDYAGGIPLPPVPGLSLSLSLISSSHPSSLIQSHV